MPAAALVAGAGDGAGALAPWRSVVLAWLRRPGQRQRFLPSSWIMMEHWKSLCGTSEVSCAGGVT